MQSVLTRQNEKKNLKQFSIERKIVYTLLQFCQFGYIQWKFFFSDTNSINDKNKPHDSNRLNDSSKWPAK